MKILFLPALIGLALVSGAAARPKSAPLVKVSRPFAGAKVNGGTVTFREDMGWITLTLSDEVQDPKTPDAHWQVVDSKGRTYVLDRMTLKGDRLSKEITLPD